MFGGNGALRQRTWKGLLRLTAFSGISDPEARPSSSLISFDDFFLLTTTFFFVELAFFAVPPPLVDLFDRFSSACSRAAKAASSSSCWTLTLTFFFGVGFAETVSVDDNSSSPSSAGRLRLGAGDSEALFLTPLTPLVVCSSVGWGLPFVVGGA